MNKKIGILTFHNAVNYGAVLQAYALEKYIEKKGIDSELIDYENPYIYREPGLKRIWKGKNFLRNIYNTLEYPFWYKRYEKFKSFIHKVCMSKKCNIEDMNKYSCVIVGSDQVWNLNITHGDFTYFLKDVKNVRKCSYASSFGTIKSDVKYYDEIRNCLNDFEIINIRESSGKNFINNLLPEKHVNLVLDPTFLLTREEWREIAVRPSYKGKYVLIYQLAYSKSLIKYAQRLAREKNCKLVTINGNPRQPIKGKNILNAGPEQWLGLIEDAECVITNSFHGTVFSIIFQKEFYTELLTTQEERNDRVITLLTELELKNRILCKGLSADTLNEKIDYLLVNQKLEKLVNFSYDCLEKVISIYEK